VVRGYRIVFRGKVQGVGFRWAARVVAARLGLRGYVRNVGNDAVEAVVVGDESRVEEFIEKLKSLETAKVESVEAEEVELAEEPKTFKVLPSTS
jgi:acylphosphatase